MDIEARITKLKKETKKYSQNREPQNWQYEWQLWYDTTVDKIKIWDGKDWKIIEKKSMPDLNVKTPYWAWVKPDSEYSTTSVISFNSASDILYNVLEIKNRINIKNWWFEITEDWYYWIQVYYFMEKWSSISRTEPTYYTTVQIRRKTKTQDVLLTEHKGTINPYSSWWWYRYTAWMYYYLRFDKWDIIYLQVVPDKQTRISMSSGNFTLIRQF
jgi:hypothetical protein